MLQDSTIFIFRTRFTISPFTNHLSKVRELFEKKKDKFKYNVQNIHASAYDMIYVSHPSTRQSIVSEIAIGKIFASVYTAEVFLSKLCNGNEIWYFFFSFPLQFGYIS